MTQSFLLDKQSPVRDQILANALAFLNRLPKTRSWRIEVKQAVKERTDPQNRALYGVAYRALSKETGFTVDELHDAFCKRFFGTVDKEVFGEVVKKPFRTTTTNSSGERDVMSSADFGLFYDMIQQVAAESGIDVPDPDAMFKVKDRWRPR